MAIEQRIVHDYYYEQELVFRLGYVNHQQAVPLMKLHDHGCMYEFVYMKKGIQPYYVEDGKFIVNHNEVFFTRPYEPHNTGLYPEEVSVLYYLIINLALISKMNVFSSADEYVYINSCFSKKKDRIFQASPMLPNAFKRFLECFNTSDRHFETRIRNALSDVLIALMTPASSVKSSQICSLEESLQYIHNHLEENIYVPSLATIQNMSVAAYSKHFVQIMGISPAEYVLKQKIEKAKDLLTTTDLSITEIAYKYGFSSSQYFSTAFKRICALTPSQFRKSVLGNNGNINNT